MTRAVKWALLSVADKTGIVEFAASLSGMGIQILSTGGTAQQLLNAGIAVREVSDYTGFPELMDGRLKTLHPAIHGAILGRGGVDDAVMAEHGMTPIGLVVVNLYPFGHTIAQADCTLERAIENIDIGGPAMLRAAAKNYAEVGVVVSPDDYARVLAALADNEGRLEQTLRFELATRAFGYTAQYDGMIACYLGAQGASDSPFPPTFNLSLRRVQNLRYGENPHQRGAFYQSCRQPGAANIANATRVQGKALSFNNIADSDTAVECCKQFSDQPACVIVKHANPCGVAVAASLLEAYDRAYTTDAESAFGGIIAVNRWLDRQTAQAIIKRQFVEVIVAPEVEHDAFEVLARKPGVRVLTTGPAADEGAPAGPMSLADFDFRRVEGGVLVQDKDDCLYDALTLVSQRQPNEQEREDLLFAWKVARFVKSNAIVYARSGATIGIGAGQMSRVNSARIAAIKAQHAGLEVAGAVMASDAFFPFRDGIDQAAEAGIQAVIQPGGSVRDAEIIAAADEHGMAMIFTGTRHFRH